jgi:hypothetical protein
MSSQSSITRQFSSSSSKGLAYTSTTSSSHVANGHSHSVIPPTDVAHIDINVEKPRSTLFGHRPRLSSDRTASMGGLEQVREQLSSSRTQARRVLGSNFDEYAFDTSITGLLEWIRDERLIRLPHKGGSWDRVLIAAQHFAEQVHRFNAAITTFESDVNAATNLVFGQCLLLLEVRNQCLYASTTVSTTHAY